MAVELSPCVYYSALMAPQLRLEFNPHLRNAREYQRALRVSMLSWISIENVKKATTRARQLNQQGGKR